MSLRQRVVELLRAREVACAVIGAGALSAHGIARSTLDLDFLTLDPRVLKPQFWASLEHSATVRCHEGDFSDPLAGVARLSAAGQEPVDIIVGRHRWQARAIERAREVEIGEVRVPVVEASDLVLLKLYAGGPQDAWDIAQLLGGPERDELAAAVERDLPDLPDRCRSLWERVAAGP